MTTDKTLLRSRFAANFKNYNSLAVVQDEICESLAEMIGRICQSDIKTGLEIGSGTGFLTRRILKLYPETEWTINDLASESELFINDITTNIGGLSKTPTYIWGDAETVDFPSNLDLIASASTLQWFDNLAQFLDSASKLIKSEGHLGISTFGPDNFHEIKITTADGLSYLTADQLEKRITEAGFEVVERLEYSKALTFDTPTDVLRHIKATGVNSIRKVRWTKKTLSEFENSYRELFSFPSGKVSLTYHPIIVVARRI